MTKKNDKHKDHNDDALNKNGSGTDNKGESNNKEIEALKSELDNYKNALLRKAAEFENYKRRTDGEISGYLKYASEGLMKQLLPVYDDLSRSIESVEKGETKDFDTLKQGILLIYDKFKDILVKEGVTETDVLGKEFDVDTCDALLQIPREDVPPHTVVDVAEKGYKLKDKVIKFAKVIVSTDMPKDQENTK